MDLYSIEYYCSKTCLSPSLNFYANSTVLLWPVSYNRLIFINEKRVMFYFLLSLLPMTAPRTYYTIKKQTNCRTSGNGNESIRKYFTSNYSSSDIVKTLLLSKIVWNYISSFFFLLLGGYLLIYYSKVMKFYHWNCVPTALNSLWYA